MATENVNESPKDALERRQAEEVKAWIEWDNVQKAAEAQIAALDAQVVKPVPAVGSTPAIPGVPLRPEQEAAKAENQKKIDDPTTGTLAKKAAIEYAWVHELKCPLRQLTADIEKAVKKERTERLVEATNRPPEGGNGTREQVQDLKAETLLHAAQVLLDHNLLPQALRSGPDQKRAAGLVRPDLAAELPSASASAELSEYADQIQPIFDRQALYAEAAKDMEKGVVVGKAGETLKEAISNPSRLGAGVAALLGLGLLYSVFKDDVSPNAGLKKWVMGILGVGAVAAGGYGALKGLDVFNTATGIRTDALLSSDSMKTVRAELELKMGTKESGVIDDMMRVFDSPIENYAQAYTDALGSHSNGMEKEKLLGGKGLTSKEAEYANNKFLKQGGDWLFMKCYDMALKDGKTSILTDADAKRAAGAHYARTEFAGLKVGSILVAIDMVEAGVGLAPAVSETRITDPHLRELESKDRAFAQVLETTDKPDVYLINGYPVRYNYTDSGDHVFTDLLGTIQFVKVDKSLTGDALQSTLLRIAEAARAEAITIYTTGTGVSRSELKYNNHGDWIIDPPRARATHAGLSSYLTGPNDPKVPVILYFDTASNSVKIGMDKDGDGVPEKRATPYGTVADVANEFEKTILHDRIVTDTSNTLLLPFTVDSIHDVAVAAPGTATDTEVAISYGGGSKGKMTYKNNKLDSYDLATTGSIDGALTAGWTKKATDVCKDKVLGDPRVQDALLRATTGYTEYNRGLMGGLVKKFIGFAKDGVDWFTNDSIQEEFEDNWEKQVVKKMTDLLYDPVTGLSAQYVDDVFKTYKSTDDFQRTEAVFINDMVTSISGVGVVTATVTPEVLPDQTLPLGEALKMARDVSPKGGTGMIRAALETLKTETPANMPGWFESAWQGAKNTVTNDAIRTEYYDKKVGEYQAKLEKAINALITTTAGPVPPGTPALTPTQPTRYQVEAEIAKIQLEAQTEAINYTGLDNPAAIKQLLLALTEDGDADWINASDKVVSYLTNNMKWEKYGVMPNPENMAQVLDLWYKRVGNLTTAPSAGPIVPPSTVPMTPAQSAEAFADYFLWEVQIRMGGHQDYSPDRFYGDVQSVSDTNFKGMITSLRSSVVAYDPTWKASPILRSNPPDMPPSLELLRTSKRKEFNDWFEVSGDCAEYLRMDGEWPEIFRISVQARLSQIIDDPYQTEASLKKDIDDFKLWVDLERSNIFEPLIGRADAKNHGYQVNTHIINSMLSYFRFSPRSQGQTDYTALITAQMLILK